MTHTIVLIISIILLIIGFIGIIIPFLPDLPLIFAGVFTYYLFSGTNNVSLLMIIVFGVFAALTLILDYILTIVGAKKFGASKYGVIGAVFGLILGFLIPGFIFIIILPVVGAIVGELISGKKWEEASKSGLGSLLGYLFSSFIKIFLATVMIAWFLIAIF